MRSSSCAQKPYPKAVLRFYGYAPPLSPSPLTSRTEAQKREPSNQVAAGRVKLRGEGQAERLGSRGFSVSHAPKLPRGSQAYQEAPKLSRGSQAIKRLGRGKWISRLVCPPLLFWDPVPRAPENKNTRRGAPEIFRRPLCIKDSH